MKEKSEVGKLFQTFYNMIETQFQVKIGIFHTDNKTEYFSEFLVVFWKKKVSTINLLVWIPLNKMELLKEKINIYLKWLVLLCFPWMFQDTFGGSCFDNFLSH